MFSIRRAAVHRMSPGPMKHRKRHGRADTLFKNQGDFIMYWLFLILMILAVIVNFFAGRFEKEMLMGVGMLLGLIAGIVLNVAINQTSSNSSVNPYAFGTFLLIMCTGIPAGIGFNLGRWLREKKS